MNPDTVIARLRGHEAELRREGVESLSVFGSTARGDADDSSDVDVAVRLGNRFAEGGFAYFGRLEEQRERLVTILGREVDIVIEPVRKGRLRHEIEKDRLVAF
jgi:uncharacterized protein